MRYNIKVVERGSDWLVLKRGKIVKIFNGPMAYDDAVDYAAELVNDADLYEANEY